MDNATQTGSGVTTAAVAHELVDLCREGRNMEAIDRLYSPDIVSVESMGNEQMPATMTGIDAVRGKNQWWYDNFEVVSALVGGPFVGEDQFAVQHEYETREKATGKTMRMIEIALYTVKNGKIVHEHFFYNPNAQ
jgi:ketosteroid isomerase-like protein